MKKYIYIYIYIDDFSDRMIRLRCSPRGDLYRCHIAWRDDVTVLIGWADCIRVRSCVWSARNVPFLLVHCFYVCLNRRDTCINR